MGLTMGSLFDGSGGFPLGAFLSGITPVWASEIEPYPIRVTTKRLPGMKHYGDIRTISGAEIEPVDLVTFGSPCTDISVAGRREGLSGGQSSLFFEAIRVISEMRKATHGQSPRFICWENVPGAYISGSGRDFQTVLSEIAKVKDSTLAVPLPEKGKWHGAGEIVGDGFSIAWRTLDAQFWGIPQRRRRCYLVADFGGGCAGKILFESEGLSGYTPAGYGEGQGVTGDAAGRLGKTGGRVAAGFDSNSWGKDFAIETSPTLKRKTIAGAIVSAGFCTEHSAQARGVGYELENSPTLRAGVVPAVVAIENHPADSRVKLDDSGTVQTLTGRMGTGGGNVPMVMDERAMAMTVSENVANTLAATDYKGTQMVFEPAAKVYGISSFCSNSMLSDNPNSGIYEAETSRTLDANGGNPACHQGGIAIVEPAYTVRRLTPLECNRLQFGYGFDGWGQGLGTPDPTEDDVDFWAGVFETQNRATGKTAKPKSRNQIVKFLQEPHSDAAEYKMWGNGVALPCVRFVMAGIAWAAHNH
jgi:DNA (cytosine-5)-methyltransferase 1